MGRHGYLRARAGADGLDPGFADRECREAVPAAGSCDRSLFCGIDPFLQFALIREGEPLDETGGDLAKAVAVDAGMQQIRVKADDGRAGIADDLGAYFVGDPAASEDFDVGETT